VVSFKHCDLFVTIRCFDVSFGTKFQTDPFLINFQK